jgi:hypothetical protein
MQHNCFPKLFTFREVGTQVSLAPMSRPSPRTVAPLPCLPPYIKDSLKEDVGFFDGGWIDWLAACEGTGAECFSWLLLLLLLLLLNYVRD